MEALELYTKLMNEAPYYAAYSKMQTQYGPPGSSVAMQVRTIQFNKSYVGVFSQPLFINCMNTNVK